MKKNTSATPATAPAATAPAPAPVETEATAPAVLLYIDEKTDAPSIGKARKALSLATGETKKAAAIYADCDRAIFEGTRANYAEKGSKAISARIARILEAVRTFPVAVPATFQKSHSEMLSVFCVIAEDESILPSGVNCAPSKHALETIRYFRARFREIAEGKIAAQDSVAASAVATVDAIGTELKAAAVAKEIAERKREEKNVRKSLDLLERLVKNGVLSAKEYDEKAAPLRARLAEITAPAPAPATAPAA